MSSVYFRDEQRDIGRHSMIFGIADDGIACAGEVLFHGAGDGGIESGENEIAIVGRFQAFDDQIGGLGWDWFVEVPLHRLGIFLSGGTLGSGDCSELKPGMAGQKLDQTLADYASGAEDSGAELSV